VWGTGGHGRPEHAGPARDCEPALGVSPRPECVHRVSVSWHLNAALVFSCGRLVTLSSTCLLWLAPCEVNAILLGASVLPSVSVMNG